MAKLSEMSNDELVDLYVKLRDRRATRKKEFEAMDTEDENKQKKIAGLMLSRYNEMGIESARTRFGTAYKQTVGRGNIADRDIVREMIAANSDNWALVTLMPNKAGIKQYIEEHGDVPPGFNWHEEIELRVVRA